MEASLHIPHPDISPSAIEGWIDGLGQVADSHVLLIGADNVELICTLIRLGCPGVSAIKLDDRVPAERVETVLVAHIANCFEAGRAIGLAARALLPTGRVFVRVAPGMVSDIETLLHRFGFRGIRLLRCGEATMVSGELPMFGLADWSVRRVQHA